MLQKKEADRAIECTFSGRHVLDLTRNFTRRSYESIIQKALDNDETLHLVRRTKTTDWFFSLSDDQDFDCLIVSNRVMAKASCKNLHKVKAVLNRVERDQTTSCCVCMDDPEVEESTISKECVQTLLDRVFTGNVGQCCPQCGNYVCSSCLKAHLLAKSVPMSSCPVCLKVLHN